MGINDTSIEDALKRLDRLTQEEARMASAQLLNIADTIDSEVREIADNVLVIDDIVAGIDDRVAGVDERVICVGDRGLWSPICIYARNAGSIALTGNQDLHRCAGSPT